MGQVWVEVRYLAPEVKLRRCQAGKTVCWYRERRTERSIPKHKGEDGRADLRDVGFPRLRRRRSGS
jgi:hypothetical protein